MMVELTVVIPTFNEEKQIKKTMQGVYAYIKKLRLNPEILVIDDSTDKTYSILKRLMKRYNNLKVKHRTDQRGVGSAIRLGIEKAKGNYIIVYMADAPNDAKYFPAILKKLREGYDIVQTSRFFTESRIIGYPFKKRICNWLCNNFIKVLFFEFKLRDFSSLFKGFNKKRVKALGLRANEFDLGLEIVLKAIRKNYRIVELPVDWKEREGGESKLKLSKYARHYFMSVMKIRLTY